MQKHPLINSSAFLFLNTMKWNIWTFHLSLTQRTPCPLRLQTNYIIQINYNILTEHKYTRLYTININWERWRICRKWVIYRAAHEQIYPKNNTNRYLLIAVWVEQLKHACISNKVNSSGSIITPAITGVLRVREEIRL